MSQTGPLSKCNVQFMECLFAVRQNVNNVLAFYLVYCVLIGDVIHDTHHISLCLFGEKEQVKTQLAELSRSIVYKKPVEQNSNQFTKVKKKKQNKNRCMK